MDERATPAVMAAIGEVLQNQIDANDPPETRLTYDRLVQQGMTSDEAWRWVSAALLQEMSLIARDARPFDREGYVAALHRLPVLIDR